MSKPASTNPESSDEIDLGHLFKLIGDGFRSLFRRLLSVYLYFKRNFYWLAGLILLGGLTGYLVGQLVDEKQQLEVIVSPNQDEANYMFNTRTYLYDVVDEVQLKIKAKDTTFFRELDMDFGKMKGFEIEIAPLTPQNEEILENGERILTALQEFERSEALSDILVSEFNNQTIRDHRVMFFFKDETIGEDYAGKILEYINSNAFYARLVQIQKDNAKERIERNDSLIAQIDRLIDVYTDRMGREKTASQSSLVLDNTELLDVPSLFMLKNELVMESEAKRMEYEMKQEPITIINFGQPHLVNKPLIQNKLVAFPSLFVGIFLLVSMVRYLNRKAEEL